jgi:predicted O-methyltransferase YrrM
MVYRKPHRRLEPEGDEIRVVRQALSKLAEEDILDGSDHDKAAFERFRAAVRRSFEIPWTAITPRMQRLIWAINAIHRPQRLIAAGCFCGFTFICNAGAAVGPGAVYDAADLVGVEIEPEEARRAERNVRRIDPTDTARVMAADAIEYVADYVGPIDLLYLDATRPEQGGKGIYLQILEAAEKRLCSGALVLAHNSVDSAEALAGYLETVRDPGRFSASVNMVVDGAGLEVSKL